MNLFRILWLGAVCLGSLLWAEQVDEGYQLRFDDHIVFEVYQEPDLSTKARVGKEGTVSFPLIGSVTLSGLTIPQAEEKLRALYEKDFLHHPRVSLSVEKYAQQWVTVAGEVRKPGTVILPDEGTLHLTDAIAQAGGANEDADQDRVLIRSQGGAVKEVSVVDQGGLQLTHGDSIMVNRKELNQTVVTVSGNVKRPGTVPFPREGELDIFTAIALAGDFTRIANKKDVLVRRGDNLMEISIGNIQSGEADMFYLLPGDIVVVKESRW